MLKEQKWYTFFRKNDEKLSYAYTDPLIDLHTKYQHVKLLRTTTFGEALFLDGSPQSSQADEFIYHEAIVHPALCLIESPREVFIAGGGEGALLREVLRHQTVTQATMVDIDKEFVDIAKEHLTSWHQNSFSDDRSKVIYSDARKTLSNSNQKFDCIIIDVTAPKYESPAVTLFTREFYQIAHEHLSEKGIIVVQAQSTNVNNLDCFSSIYKTMQAVFPNVYPYVIHLPFDGDSWSFIMGCHEQVNPAKQYDSIDTILDNRGISNLRYYDGETHLSLFSLPKHVRDALKRKTVEDIIEDKNPFVYKALK